VPWPVPYVAKVFVVDLDTGTVGDRVFLGHRARLYAKVWIDRRPGRYRIRFIDRTEGAEKTIEADLRWAMNNVGVEWKPTKPGKHEIEVCVDGNCRKFVVEVLEKPKLKGMPSGAYMLVEIFLGEEVSGTVESAWDVRFFNKHVSRYFRLHPMRGSKVSHLENFDGKTVEEAYINAKAMRGDAGGAIGFRYELTRRGAGERIGMPKTVKAPIRRIVITVGVCFDIVGPCDPGLETRKMILVFEPPSDPSDLTKISAWLKDVKFYEFGEEIDLGLRGAEVISWSVTGYGWNDVRPTIVDGRPCIPIELWITLKKSVVEWLLGPFPIEARLEADKTEISPSDTVSFRIVADVLRDLPVEMISRVVCSAIVYEVETKVTPDGRVITIWKGPEDLTFESEEKDMGPATRGRHVAEHVVRIEIPRGKVFDPGHPYVTCRGEIVLRKPKKKKGEQPTWGAGEESVEEGEESVEVINL